MRFKYKFYTLTPQKELMSICMDVASAGEGWSQIYKEFDVFVPEPKYEGPELREDPEDPKAFPCTGCSSCGGREEGEL